MAIIRPPVRHQPDIRSKTEADQRRDVVVGRTGVDAVLDVRAHRPQMGVSYHGFALKK
jgi:hypothetical protein